MGDSIDVEITIGFDARHLERQLVESEVDVMQKHRNKMLEGIDVMWRGWKYRGVPADRQGRSRRAWRGYEQTTEGIRQIIIENNARTYPNRDGSGGGKPYAAYITRSGAAREEWRIVREKLLLSFVPALIDDLESEIARNLNVEGPPKKVRENKTSTKSTFQIEG